MMKPHQVAVVLLLTLHTWLLGYGAWWMSPTLDEPAHVVAGISHWRFGDFSLYRVNPPLVRMIASVPALVLGYQCDFPELSKLHAGRYEFHLGESFVHDNGRWSLWLTTLGRWACIPFSWLGGLVCYRWAKELYGLASGLWACSLWCFSPMVLGHAALLTPDAHAAALGALACYTFWLWLRTPTWQRAISTGLILGLAELSKTTLILLYPIWPLLWITYRWHERRKMTWRRWRDEAAMLALRMLIGLYLINLGYLANGSFVPLKQYTFASELFGNSPSGDADRRGLGTGNRFSQSWLGELPVPLPYDYVMGIDTQQRDFENFRRPSYLRGEFQERGWWYYYAYAALIKTPLGTWALIGLALYTRWRRVIPSALWRDELIVLAPAAIIFFVVSSKTGFSHHYRYVFPCLPLVMIWTSQVAAVWSGTAQGFDNRRGWSTWRWCAWRSRGWRSLTTVCLAASIGSSLWHFPHSLAYFNEAVGGPRHGADHLINSNIDWGQDLLHLERWIAKQTTGQTVYLAFDDYLNPFDLEIAQIAPWPIPQSSADDQSVGEPEVPDGYYAISVNQLYEFPWPLRQPDGSLYFIDTRPLQALRGVPPVGWAGYSIRIYSAQQLRAAYRAVEIPQRRYLDST